MNTLVTNTMDKDTACLANTSPAESSETSTSLGFISVPKNHPWAQKGNQQADATVFKPQPIILLTPAVKAALDHPAVQEERIDGALVMAPKPEHCTLNPRIKNVTCRLINAVCEEMPKAYVLLALNSAANAYDFEAFYDFVSGFANHPHADGEDRYFELMLKEMRTNLLPVMTPV